MMVLHDLKRPLTLEVIPSATYSRRQTRATPDVVRPRRLRPRRGAVREVRHHLLGHRRGHDQPRLQPGGERRLPGRGQPALPALLLREAALLHGGAGHVRAGGRGRRRGHAHGGAHAQDRRPVLGRQDHGHRGPGGLRAAGRGRRGAGPPGGGRARRTRSWATARSSTSRAASTAWAARATWAPSSPTPSSATATTAWPAPTSP